MYFRFIGLTAFQTGILGCTRPLVNFWASPLLRILAERTNKRKFFLLSLLLAAVISNISLGFTNTDDYAANFRKYVCKRAGDSDLDFNRTISRVNGSNFSPLNASTKNSGINNPTGVIDKSIVTSLSNLSSPGGASTQLHDTGVMNHNMDGPLENDIKIFEVINSNSSGDQVIHSKLVLAHHVNNSLTIKESLHNNITQLEVQSEWYLAYGLKIDHTFKVLLTLVFFCELFSSPISSIGRSISSDIMRQSQGSRLCTSVWTSLGTMLGGGVLVITIGYHHCDFGLKNSFYLHFYIFASFSVLSFFLGVLLKEHEKKSHLTLRFGKTFAYLCCDINMICFLAVLLVLGMAESLMYNFMMWYLQDIGASIVVMATIIVTSAFSEIPTVCISKRLIHCFGHHWVIFVSLFCYGGRFLYFSYFRNPWVILPIELLRGFSYTTVHTACGSYAATVSLQGTEKTMKVIFSTVYYGLGMGIGGIAVALLYQLHGPTVVFRCAAGVCGIYALVFAMLQCILILPDGDRSGGKLMEYQQINLDGEAGDIPLQADWLMEALRAEEDGEDETHFVKGIR